MNDLSAQNRGKYRLTETSSLFPELWAIYVAWISLAATVALHGQHAAAARVMSSLIGQALSAGEEAGRKGEPIGNVEVRASLWQFPERLCAPSGSDMLVVRDALALFQKVSLPEQELPNELMFEIIATEESEEKYAVPESHSHQPPMRYLANAWGYILAAGYERHERRMIAAYGKKAMLRTWPQELQFFHHVRNACSHGGKFDIWKNKRIDYAAPPRWRDKVLASEDAVDRLYAVDGLLTMADTILLVHDISLLLDGLSEPQREG